ncbi:MAG: response regulator [Anaerolineae bacterium]|nr:response regulator [Anaerolineae bacterium]
MAKRKILVVDDDADLRRLMSLTLGMAGFDVVTAVDGEDALTKVRAERPDLVLLDIMMPKMDGYETCRRLRKLPEGANIPVIMLSAADQVTDKVRGLRAGANDYISKAADSREILARIEAHLRPTAARPAHITGILGAKSGVGATILAVNLAIALQQAGDRSVALLDWHLPMGDVSTMLGLTPRHTLDEFATQIDELDAQMLEQVMLRHPSGIQIIPSSQSLDTTALTPDALDPVLDVASRMVNYIVIDAGWAADTAWIQPLEVVDELLFLVTPELSVLRRTALYLEWERNQALFGDRLRLVINRDGVDGGVPASEIEALLHVKVFARLPEDAERVMFSINQGTPLVQSAPRSALARSISRLARELVKSSE